MLDLGYIQSHFRVANAPPGQHLERATNLPRCGLRRRFAGLRTERNDTDAPSKCLTKALCSSFQDYRARKSSALVARAILDFVSLSA